jgi:hypothetical protein
MCTQERKTRSVFQEILQVIRGFFDKKSCVLCRVREGANTTERTPCANGIGALEKSIRSYLETRGEYVIDLTLGMTFDSLSET